MAVERLPCSGLGRSRRWWTGAAAAGLRRSSLFLEQAQRLAFGRTALDLLDHVLVGLLDRTDQQRVFGLVARDTVHHELDRVDAVEEEIEGVLLDRNAARPELTEHVLGLVGNIADTLEAHHRSRTLESMGRPEQLIDDAAVRRILLQGQQPLIEVLDVLPGLYEEELDNA